MTKPLEHTVAPPGSSPYLAEYDPANRRGDVVVEGAGQMALIHLVKELRRADAAEREMWALYHGRRLTGPNTAIGLTNDESGVLHRVKALRDVVIARLLAGDVELDELLLGYGR